MVQHAKPATDEDERGSRPVRVVTSILIALVVLFCWLPRLRWGLRLDETFSAWQAEGGWSIARTKLDNPGQSVLFGYVEALFYFPGASCMEIALRLPAVIGALVSAFFVWRLAEAFVGRGAGFVAVVPFVCNLYVVRSACEARPYTLATAACLASLWSLRRWLDDGRRRHLVLWAVSSALVVHLHLMYAVFFAVPAVLVAVYVAQGRHVGWRALAAAFILAALLVAPLAPFTRDFLRRSAGLSFMAPPGWGRLLDVLAPVTVLVSVPGVVVLLARFGRRRVGAALPLGMAISWLLLPPLLLFAASRATGQTVLNERYLLHTVAAQSLIVAVLYRQFPASLARVALLACFLPIPLFLGASDWKRADGYASYRAPFLAARRIDPTAAAPLFMQAGHPLSNAVDWRHLNARGSFLYSQLSAYALPNHVFPLPYALDDVSMSFVSAAAAGPLRAADTILFIGEPELGTAAWLKTFFEARGYVGTFEARQGIGLLVLRRGSPMR